MVGWFIDVKKFPDIDRLRNALDPGVPVDVCKGGDLPAALEYGNDRSTIPQMSRPISQLVADVQNSRAVVFDKQRAGEIMRLRISPLDVVEAPKSRVINGPSFPQH